MTLPTSGAISINDINNEFGLGRDLANYKGATWYKDDASTGTFSSTNLDLDQFHGKRHDNPVIPGSVTITVSQQFVMPNYNSVTFIVNGAAGGGGSTDNEPLGIDGNGGNGGGSSFVSNTTTVTLEAGGGGAGGGAGVGFVGGGGGSGGGCGGGAGGGC